MRLPGCIFCVLLMIMLAGCATSVRLNAVPSQDQTVRYDAGTENLISEKESGVVGLRINPLTQLTNGLISICVVACNRLDTPSTISSENVRAACAGKELKVHSPEDIVESMERRRKTALVLMALGGGMQGAAAYNAASTRSYSGTVYGPGYTANYSGTVQDPAAGMQAQAMVNQQTAQQMDQINSSLMQSMQGISESALKKQTIQPGQIYGGMIFFDSGGYSSEKRRMRLEVDFNGETHKFQIDARN